MEEKSTTEVIMDNIAEVVGIVSVTVICTVVAFKLGGEGSEILAGGVGGLVGYLTKSVKDKLTK